MFEVAPGKKEWCSFLASLYDNVIELDNEKGTLKCIRTDSDFGIFPQSSMRMIAEDVISAMVESGFSDDEGSVVALVKKAMTCTEKEAVCFCARIREEEHRFVGMLVPLGSFCWLCYQNADTLFPCAVKADGASAPRRAENGSAVDVVTFGFFDVYHNGKAVFFSSKKAKELLAVIVDRKGGYVSSADGAAILWPDEEDGPCLRSRFRKVAMLLTQTLAENGIEDILEVVHGKRRIVPEKINCDFFDYLQNKNENGTIFPGVYMQSYAWGEVTRLYLEKM